MRLSAVYNSCDIQRGERSAAAAAIGFARAAGVITAYGLGARTGNWIAIIVRAHYIHILGYAHTPGWGPNKKVLGVRWQMNLLFIEPAASDVILITRVEH